MFERFTEHARQVMAFENQAAQSFHHEYLGTEHLLLGLTRQKDCVGMRAVADMGIDPRDIRKEIMVLIEAGPEYATTEHFHQTKKAKEVIDLSIKEARNLKHDYVGTEHLLLAVLSEQCGVAAHALGKLGLDHDGVRDAVIRVLSKSE